jgi:predicted TPR repeat methyltransferase
VAAGKRNPARPGQAAPHPLFRQAFELQAQGRIEPAIAALRKLLGAQPEHFDALALLGTLEGQSGRFEIAQALLRRALALRPASASAHNNLGNVLASGGHFVQALECFERSLTLRPAHARTLHNRAKLLRTLGRSEEALQAVDTAIGLEPASPDFALTRAGLLAELARHTGAGTPPAAQAVAAYHHAQALGADAQLVAYALAALGEGQAPQASPRDYVRRLFDEYAPQFDGHLRDTLGYRTPELLVGEALRCAGRQALDVLDLGCGTGLCGPLLRPAARSLAGVDLSANMVEQARLRGCYDRLACAEVTEYLLAAPGAFDLAVAADVLVYIGDLVALMAAAHAALRPPGLLAISVEAHGGEGYVLQASRRYAHAESYVRSVAQAQGFEVEAMQAASLRQDRDERIEGLLFVLRRR